MGVKGLWSLVSHTGTPVRLETLTSKTLAIDASIWLHQFLKAMRGKDGSPLPGGHLTGFFHRIAKLLFYGIRPVFVYDGVAPGLKRATLNARRSRKAGFKESAKSTAQKLLRMQLKLAAVEQVSSLPKSMTISPAKSLTVNPLRKDQESSPNQKRKRDEFELPKPEKIQDLATFDTRLVTDEELRDFVNSHRHSINLETANIESSAFKALPIEMQHQIILDLKAQSRQPSQKRLENMLENSKTALDFSQHQIKHLVQRNYYTEQSYQVAKTSTTATNSRLERLQEAGFQGSVQRVAGQRNRQYALYKEAEGGYTMSVSQASNGKDSDTTATHAPQRESEVVDLLTDSEDDDFATLLNRVKAKQDRQAQESAQVSNAKEDRAVEITAFSPPRKNTLNGPIHDPHRDEDEDVSVKIIGFSSPTRASPLKPIVSPLTPTVPVDLSSSPVLPPHPSLLKTENGVVVIDDEEETSFKSISDNSLAVAPNAWVADDESIESIMARFEDMEKSDQAMTANLPTFVPEAPPTSPNWSVGVQEVLPPATVSDWAPAPSPPDWPALPDTDFLQYWISYIPPVARTHIQHHISRMGTIILDYSLPELEHELVMTLKRRGKCPLHGDLDQAYEFFEAFVGAVKSRKEEIYRREAMQWDGEGVGAAVQIDELESAKSTSIEGINNGEQESVNSSPGVPSDTPLPQPAQDIVSGSEEDDDDEDMEVFIPAPGSRPTSPPRPQTPPPIQPQKLGLFTPTQKELESMFDINGEDFGDVTDLEGVFSSPVARAGVTMLDPADCEFEQEEVPTTVTEPQKEPVYTKDIIQEELVSTEEIIQEGQDVNDGLDRTDVAHNMEEEQEELDRFIAEIGDNPALATSNLREDIDRLTLKRYQEMRDASDMTTAMIHETQELLRLFGLPFLVAPTEAESQCAHLLSSGLVDGIVTDDSDVFLFGGTQVYRHFFDQQKFCEVFSSNGLTERSGLTREKLIQLAFLLGSDYTEGLPGVGPVTALEILKEWSGPGLSGLVEFREWADKVQSSLLDPLDSKIRKKLRKVVTKIEFPESFPDPRVESAYKAPEVNTSMDPFIFGSPDLDKLRWYMEKNLGWAVTKTDGVLIPVIKEIHKRSASTSSVRVESQPLISDFFRPLSPPVPTGTKSKTKNPSSLALSSTRVQSILTEWASEGQTTGVASVSPHFSNTDLNNESDP